jgi:hypothetical protein
MAFHCSEIERSYALRRPCHEPAVRVYVREDGVRVGYCVKHTSAGIAEAGRKGWEKAA